MDAKHKLPAGFQNPIDLPRGTDAQATWQHLNREWWETNPMRYDWNQPIEAEERSREFFEEIDRRHFFDASRYLRVKQRPFDELIPFERLGQMDVLEIGVGNGSHAQLIATHCRTYTGIDLTQYAVASTQRRFELFKIDGRVLQMDAEHLEFPDSSFDFIWTWGVIHHSANTE